MSNQYETTQVFVPDVANRTGLKNLDTSAFTDKNDLVHGPQNFNTILDKDGSSSFRPDFEN